MTPRQRCAALYRSGVTDTHELARRFARSHRQICRWLLAEGARPPRELRSDREYAQIDTLLAEGMPASWVAAEFPGIPYVTILDRAHRVPGHEEMVREWKATWARIAATPELLEIHWEIAPPTLRDQKVRRAA